MTLGCRQDLGSGTGVGHHSRKEAGAFSVMATPIKADRAVVLSVLLAKQAPASLMCFSGCGG